MTQKLYEESNIQAIANAIRSKLGISSKMRTSEMASKINAISSGVVRKTGSFTVNANSESYTFSTGLSRVHSVMVRGDNSSDVNNTFAWYYDDVQTVGLCAYTSRYVTGHTTTPHVSISGGDVTCSQYSSDYPIVNKTFKWVAYGE